MSIGEVKKQEMQDILDFYYGIQEYGHIFLLDPKLLDKPFNKILEGIREVNQMMNDSWEM